MASGEGARGAHWAKGVSPDTSDSFWGSGLPSLIPPSTVLLDTDLPPYIQKSTRNGCGLEGSPEAVPCQLKMTTARNCNPSTIQSVGSCRSAENETTSGDQRPPVWREAELGRDLHSPEP